MYLGLSNPSPQMQTPDADPCLLADLGEGSTQPPSVGSSLDADPSGGRPPPQTLPQTSFAGGNKAMIFIT